MKVAGGVGKHVQDVLLGTDVIWATRLERGQLVPDWEPLLLHIGNVIALVDEITRVIGGHGLRLQGL